MTRPAPLLFAALCLCAAPVAVDAPAATAMPTPKRPDKPRKSAARPGGGEDQGDQRPSARRRTGWDPLGSWRSRKSSKAGSSKARKTPAGQRNPRSIRARRSLLVPRQGRSVESLTLAPEEPTALFVFAHGGGSPMDSAFMTGIANRLAERGVATFRFNFPYMQDLQAGHEDVEPDAQADFEVIRSAIAEARARFPGVPLIIGGKSRGGALSSILSASEDLGEDGLVFLGYPLHRQGKPKISGAQHLVEIDRPMLLVQGSRDPLGELDQIRRVHGLLGARARLHIIEGGDHSYRIPPGSSREVEPLVEAADAVADWIEQLSAGR